MTDRSRQAPQEGPADPLRRARGLEALDDADAAVYTIGQAAELLGIPVAGLRRLDDADVLIPHRSAGGQRRYSRRQLERAERLSALIEQGTPIAAAGRIADLEGQVADLEGQVADLRERLPEPRATIAGTATGGLTSGTPATGEVTVLGSANVAAEAATTGTARADDTTADTASPDTASAGSAGADSPT